MIPGIVAGVAVQPNPDPYAAFRVSILNLQTDLADPKRTWTAGGDAAVSGGFLELDGSGDYIETPSSSDFNIGTSDFCFEAYVTLDSAPGSECAALSRWGASGYDFFFGFNASAQPVLYYYDSGGSASYPVISSALSLSVEAHVAWYKGAAGSFISINGVPYAIPAVASIRNLPQVVRIGGTADNGSWMDGRIRGARMTIGSSGGYGASSFTPPALPLPT